LRPLGKCVPAEIAACNFSPGKNFPARQNLPGWTGKYFHFSKKVARGNPAILRKTLVHDGTAQGKRALRRRITIAQKKPPKERRGDAFASPRPGEPLLKSYAY